MNNNCGISRALHYVVVFSTSNAPFKFITDQTAVVAGYPNSQDSGSEGPTAEELVQKYMERVRSS